MPIDTPTKNNNNFPITEENEKPVESQKVRQKYQTLDLLNWYELTVVRPYRDMRITNKFHFD